MDDSERREYSTLIPVLVKIFNNKRNCPTITILAAKTICTLVCHESDYKNKLILLQNNIIGTINNYIIQRNEEKIVLAVLELLYLVLPESKLNIDNYLYGEMQLMKTFMKLLEGPGYIGTYFSIRVFIIYYRLMSRL